MEKRSVLAKILILVVLALVVPMFASAQNVCYGYCGTTCPAGSYDCTSDWVYSSWTNFQAALAMWYAGYEVLVCCQ